MVVLCKPGKLDYSIPKAYHPIALINTMGKLLTAVVAKCLPYTLEHYQLPNTHFGGQPRYLTTDFLHLLEETVKNIWRTCKVASALFLDIEGAFPNAVTKHLIHNMWMWHIPGELVDFTEWVLTNRQTRLQFNGFTSEWIQINNGIGQGNPLSMILYIIYSSDLVEATKSHRGNKALKELTLAFVDDMAFITIGKDFETTHTTLADILEHPEGGYKWSRNHNSKFETNKFVLIDFLMNHQKNCPNMHIQGTTICLMPTHWFLGVIVNQELQWNAQVDNAVAKGMIYVCQLHHLSSSAKGLLLRLMHQLYQAVAILKMLYVADLWFTPTYQDSSDSLQWGSIRVAKHLTSIQWIAALSITGAIRTTATDLLEVHANLLPISLLLQNMCHWAIIHIATHPNTHLLYDPIRRAARCFINSHHTFLHQLTHQFKIDPREIETLIPSHRSPTSRNPFKMHIEPSKQEAIEKHAQILDTIQVYSDSSGYQGQIGAVAILFHSWKWPHTLHFYLGKEEEHVVYEVEAVRLTLAAELIATEEDLTFPISICVNNQAVIQTSEDVKTMHKG